MRVIRTRKILVWCRINVKKKLWSLIPQLYQSQGAKYYRRRRAKDEGRIWCTPACCRRSLVQADHTGRSPLSRPPLLICLHARGGACRARAPAGTAFVFVYVTLGSSWFHNPTAAPPLEDHNKRGPIRHNTSIGVQLMSCCVTPCWSIHPLVPPLS
jgi:hypothetical protein